MRVTVERLRMWIIVLAGLLLTGIIFFFGYARWQVRRVVRDLPGKLGISIQQSTAGYTFSKSQGGHTSFTVHAAKMVQYKNGGRAELHDVSITLYDPKGAQADRIYGNDFDYDPGNGVVRANGPVRIDLQGPAATGPHSATIPSNDSNSKNIVHVETSDLVFNQKTGLASTPQHIEFRIAEDSGSAQGASFDSSSGVLILESKVSFNSSMNGNPLTVHAIHAQFDRLSRQLYLLQSQAAYESSHSSSDQSVVYFRQDGSAFRIDSQGHVTTTDEDEKIVSQTGRFDLDAKSQPVQAFLDGGVFYTAKQPARSLYGNANSAKLSFGPQTSIRHAQLLNAVSVVDTEQIPQPQVHLGRRPANTPVSTSRDVQGSQVDIDFAPPQDRDQDKAEAKAQGNTRNTPLNRRPMAQHILVVGGAKLDIRTLYAATPPQDTQVQGDQLFATLRDGVAVSSLRGNGHTKVTLLNSNGVKQTSTGDTLLMTFADGPKEKALSKPAAQPAAQLESSEQQGHVTLDQLTPAASGPGRGGAAVPQPAEIFATAERAAYTASSQLVTLSGNPRIRQANGDVAATTIQFQRDSGNATATGSVQATYRRTGSGSEGQAGVSFGGTDPVHVVADHARFDHQKDLTIFYGKGSDARLWQGADSVVAPVLELSRLQQTLSAHGDPASDAKAVTSVFTNSGGTAPEGAASEKKSGPPSVVRVKSRTLFYSDAEDKAVFRGGVVAQDASGSIRSDGMDIYLTTVTGPSANRPDVQGKPKQGAEKSARKEIDRIVAQGDVQLDQPGRRGTGEKLVYNEQDGKFVLTGTAGALPRMADRVHGTVTGASLIFNNRDDSVIVSGGTSKAVTETRTAK